MKRAKLTKEEKNNMLSLYTDPNFMGIDKSTKEGRKELKIYSLINEIKNVDTDNIKKVPIKQLKKIEAIKNIKTEKLILRIINTDDRFKNDKMIVVKKIEIIKNFFKNKTSELIHKDTTIITSHLTKIFSKEEFEEYIDSKKDISPMQKKNAKEVMNLMQKNKPTLQFLKLRFLLQSIWDLKKAGYEFELKKDSASVEEIVLYENSLDSKSEKNYIVFIFEKQKNKQKANKFFNELEMIFDTRTNKLQNKSNNDIMKFKLKDIVSNANILKIGLQFLTEDKVIGDSKEFSKITSSMMRVAFFDGTLDYENNKENIETFKKEMENIMPISNFKNNQSTIEINYEIINDLFTEIDQENAIVILINPQLIQNEREKFLEYSTENEWVKFLTKQQENNISYFIETEIYEINWYNKDKKDGEILLSDSLKTTKLSKEFIRNLFDEILDKIIHSASSNIKINVTEIINKKLLIHEKTNSNISKSLISVFSKLLERIVEHFTEKFKKTLVIETKTEHNILYIITKRNQESRS